MRELSVVAENLRLVQRARRTFLDLWKVETDYVAPMLDRMADDLRQAVPAEADDPAEPPGGAGDTNDTL